MKKNNLVFLNRLHNQVFPVAYEKICSQLENEEFSVDSVQQSFDSASSFINELRYLKNTKFPHPLTKVIAELRDERHQSILSFKGRINSFLRSPIVVERNAANVLHGWFAIYQEFYNSPSISGQTGMINGMSKDIIESAVLSDSLEALNLSITMNSLVTTTSKIKEHDETRLKDRKAALLKAKTLRGIAYKKMMTLWKSIEVAIELKAGDVVKLTEYLNDINWAMVDFKTSVLSKTTRRVNAALKAEEEKQNVDHENEGPINLALANGGHEGSFKMVNVNGVVVNKIPVNGNSEQFTAEIPKTVSTEQRFQTNGSDQES